MIKRLLGLVGRWARKPVNHTSWVAVVTPTGRPKSVRNRCLIELFCGVVCVVTLPFWHFCWCRGFCHRTESDLFLFLVSTQTRPISYYWTDSLEYVHVLCPRTFRTTHVHYRWTRFHHLTGLRLAKQDTLTPTGHLLSPMVSKGPWMSTVVLLLMPQW